VSAKKSNRPRTRRPSVPQARGAVADHSKVNTSDATQAESQPLPAGWDAGWLIWDSHGVREMTRQEVRRLLGLPQEAP